MRILVSGRVQGVGYRFYAQRAARALGLCGFVRNLGDGRVEAVASGPVAAVEQFVAELARGPESGHVTACQASPSQAAVESGEFRIAY